MEKEIKESVGALMAHIIKIDNRDVEKETSVFCNIMGVDFDCTKDEAKEILHTVMSKEYDLDEHIEHINQALCKDKLSKFHLLEQLNHVIYSDTIDPNDYKVFEEIKDKLFDC